MKNWDDLRYFLAVARSGNVTAACDELEVNHSTISRRISAFEKRIGVKLFDRLPSGYAPTTMAEELLGNVQKIEADIIDVSRKLSAADSRMAGTLRMTAPEGMVSVVLMPKILEFTKLYPGIEIEIIATADIKSLNNREVDLAIRASSQPAQGLVGRRLAEQNLGKYASHKYLDARGLTAETILEHCPNSDSPEHTWAGLLRDKATPDWVSAHYAGAKCAMRLDTVYSLFEAVKAGIGIAELPCRLGNADPSLIRVPPLEPVKHQDIWILYHRDMRHMAKLRALSEHLSTAIVAERDLYVR